MTLQEVARKANVSLATASLALNNHPRVAVQTRERVAQVAEGLGFMNPGTYAARRLARTRRQSRSTNFDQVGFIYLSGTGDVDQYCLNIMRGAEHELSPLGACLIFVRVGERSHWEKVERLAQTGIVDGWMIIGAVDDAVMQRLNALRLPWVILGDHHCTRGRVHCVSIDHVHLGRAGAQRLADLGHRRVGYIGASMLYQYQTDTLRGFREAVHDLKLDTDERLTTFHNFWCDVNQPELKNWFDYLGERPSAIFCAEPGKAELLVRELNQAGVRVPEDCSVLGCEAPMGIPVPPTHARLDLPVDDVGVEGAKLLHKLVTDGPRVVSSTVRLAAALHDGWSAVPRTN
jgi:LacI family transcriptional regulator